MGEKPRCRILIVEDEAMIAMLVEDMVLDFGSEVVGPAAKMDDAMRLAQAAALDAAILDVNVGGS
jgi:DNA-binding response OmpR family regulator